MPGAAEAHRDPPPKYINSPESPIYTKGNLLFGLFQARHAIQQDFPLRWRRRAEGHTVSVRCPPQNQMPRLDVQPHVRSAHGPRGWVGYVRGEHKRMCGAPGEWQVGIKPRISAFKHAPQCAFDRNHVLLRLHAPAVGCGAAHADAQALA
ncbi:MAG TPA: hypothetical protein PLD10_25470, partial [Rhodopila sp.]|nr:hypothetical protein [Rhodopila sp.]